MISLIEGQSSVNISLALRARDIFTSRQPMIYWATNHCKPEFISETNYNQNCISQDYLPGPGDRKIERKENNKDEKWFMVFEFFEWSYWESIYSGTPRPI